MSYLISGEGKSIIDSILGRDLAWVTPEAGCHKGKNPDAFFPNFSGATSKAAKEICAECPLQVACADYGLTHSVLGIWGGLTEHDRRKVNGRQQPCGTLAGYRRHRRNAEDICDRCAAARRTYLDMKDGAA